MGSSPSRPITSDGGIGRRARLRALCPQGREGSSPSLTILPVGVMVAQVPLKHLVFVRNEYRQLNLSCLVTERSKVADCNSAVDKIPVAGSNPADSSKNLELCTSGLCGHPAKVLGANSVPKVRILPTPLISVGGGTGRRRGLKNPRRKA